jgi:hypothetical protein
MPSATFTALSENITSFSASTASISDVHDLLPQADKFLTSANLLMRFLDHFRKNRRLTEEQRREFLLKNGRITEGTILDNDVTESGGEIVYYLYSVSGADFESSDVLTPDQLLEPVKYAPGAKVSIRFDPKNHSNSVLV